MVGIAAQRFAIELRRFLQASGPMVLDRRIEGDRGSRVETPADIRQWRRPSRVYRGSAKIRQRLLPCSIPGRRRLGVGYQGQALVNTGLTAMAPSGQRKNSNRVAEVIAGTTARITMALRPSGFSSILIAMT